MTQRRQASRTPARKPKSARGTRKPTKRVRKPGSKPVTGVIEAPLHADVPFASFPEVAHPKKRAYLAAYVQLGNKVRASAAAGTDRKTTYNWRRDTTDTVFQEAWRLAQALAAEHLEAEAMRRATEGVRRPVYQQGRLVGYEQVYSDTLLIFLLKGALPEKYRERIEARNSSVDAFVKFLEDAAAVPALPAQETPDAPTT